MEITVHVKSNREIKEYRCKSNVDIMNLVTYCLTLNVYHQFNFKQIGGHNCSYVKKIFIDGEKILLDVPKRFEIHSFDLAPYFKRYDKEIKVIIRRATDQILTNAHHNPKEITIRKVSDDRFVNRTRIVLENGETIFSDAEIKQLLQRITTPFRRRLLSNFELNKFALHQIAMKCYDKYGGAVLSFLLDLPKADFAQKNITNVKNYENDHGEIPSLELSLRGRSNEKYCLCFYASITRIDRLVASLYKREGESKMKVADLTNQAYFEYRIETDKSQLELLISNLNNPGVIYCGVKEGECILCGRSLTDPRFCLLGYGRICADHLNIPY